MPSLHRVELVARVLFFLLRWGWAPAWAFMVLYVLACLRQLAAAQTRGTAALGALIIGFPERATAAFCVLLLWTMLNLAFWLTAGCLVLAAAALIVARRVRRRRGGMSWFEKRAHKATWRRTAEELNIAPGKVVGVTPTATGFDVNVLMPGRHAKRIDPDEVARRYRARAVLVEPYRDPVTGKVDHGIARLRIRRTDPLSGAIAAPVFEPQGMWKPVSLGLDEDHAPVLCSLVEPWPHLLPAGVTGSGKSMLLTVIVIQCLLNDHDLLLLDGKVTELDAFSGVALVEADWDAARALALLQGLLALIRVRYRQIRDAGYRKLGDAHAAGRLLEHRVVTCIIDEFPEYAASEVGKEIQDTSARIAKIGRAAGVALIPTTQGATLDDFHGPLRRNLVQRMALGDLATREHAEAILGHGLGSDAARLAEPAPGRFVGYLAGRVVLGRVWHMDDAARDDAMERVVAMRRGRPPLRLPEPDAAAPIRVVR